MGSDFARTNTNLVRSIRHVLVKVLAVLGGVGLLVGLTDLRLSLAAFALLFGGATLVAFVWEISSSKRSVSLWVWGVSTGRSLDTEDVVLSAIRPADKISNGLAVTSPPDPFFFSSDWEALRLLEGPWVLIVAATADELGKGNFGRGQRDIASSEATFQWQADWGVIEYRRSLPEGLNNSFGSRAKDLWAIPSLCQELHVQELLPEHMVDNEVLRNSNLILIGGGDTNSMTALLEQAMIDRFGQASIPFAPRLVDPSLGSPNVHNSEAIYIPVAHPDQYESTVFDAAGMPWRKMDERHFPTLGMVRKTCNPFNSERAYVLACGVRSLGTMGAVAALTAAIRGDDQSGISMQIQEVDSHSFEAGAFLTVVTEVHRVGGSDRDSTVSPIKLNGPDNNYRDSDRPHEIGIWGGESEMLTPEEVSKCYRGPDDMTPDFTSGS